MRPFVIPGREKQEQVSVFDKRDDRTFITNIANIAAERGFNTVLGDQPGAMEASLSDLESNAAPAFQKVRDSRWLGVLSGEERVWIAVFAAAQRLRVRNLREAMKHFDAGVVERIRQLGGDPNAVKGFQPFRNEEEVRHFSLGFLEKAMPAFATLILSKRWLLFETSRTCPFWLSDTPISMHNYDDFGPSATIGFSVRCI